MLHEIVEGLYFHCSLSVCVSDSSCEQNSSQTFWKFNASLLKDPIYDKSHIRAEVRKFYSSLYSRTEVENGRLSDLVHNLPTLNDNEANELEGELTLEELSVALKNMKNGRSPGSDGFPVEFFKFFWKKLGIFVLRSLNDGFRRGQLSTTQKEGIIVCLPKTDKSRDLIKNWRPISLLNIVYKIGSASIANRIKKVLPSLIHEDQTGFIKGRYIGDNVRLIYDIINHVTTHNKPGILLCLDFEKAFDSLDWGFMFQVLSFFGFKQDILNWISVFYNDIKSTVLVNGNISDWFPILRGCRQGDPISPYLFVLCVEIMGNMIRTNANIKGITINQREYKLTQYADDSELLLDGDRESFEQSLHTVETFGKLSGLKLNISKTSATWLGSNRNSNIKYLPHLQLQWNPDKFKILGIWFTNDLNDCVDLNYNEKFREILILYKIWLKRQLTPLGSVAILKSLILSKLTFLWILLPNPPDNMVQQIQNSVFEFVWNCKNDKVSRKTSTQSVEKGGLGIPDIRIYMDSLKLSWVKKAMTCNLPWKYILIENCPLIQKLEHLGTQLPKSNRLNDFLTNLLDAYARFGQKINVTNCDDALAEPIFYNNKIRIGNNCIYHDSWYNAGIRYVKDLICNNGNFLTFQAFNVKYNVNGVNFFTHMQCVAAIRTFLRRESILVENSNSSTVNATVRVLFSCLKGSQKFYRILNSSNVKPNFSSTWEAKLVCTIDWNTIFYIVNRIKEVKLKWFQMRIVQRILGTNVTLRCMNLRQNDNCSFCDRDRENITHLFLSCNIVKNFLEQVKTCFVQAGIIQRDFILEPLLLLFGYSKAKEIDETFLYVMLVLRFYIYKCRCEGSLPQHVAFIQYLHKKYLVEHEIARQNLKLENFEQRWLKWQSLFP